MGRGLRRRSAGPPAAAARARNRGVGRSTSIAAEWVSDDLRRGTGDFLEQRRRIAGLYQFGLVRRIPEPPLRIAAAHIATLPLALPEAMAALRRIRNPRGTDIRTARRGSIG